MKVTAEILEYAISDDDVRVHYKDGRMGLIGTVHIPWDGETFTKEMVRNAIAKDMRRVTRRAIPHEVLKDMLYDDLEIEVQ